VWLRAISETLAPLDQRINAALQGLREI